MQGTPFDEPTLPGQGGRFAAGMKILGGRFVLERQLGRGGMGEVWLARDAELGDRRALKFLPGEVAHDPKALSQLRREAAAGQRLSHPRIVKTHDLHVGDGHAAVAMEYVEGKTLNELQAEIEKGYFEVAELAGWVKDVCEALAYAHGEAKVVHRDLKPSNIIIEKATGRAKVLDFGISRRISETHTQITGKDSSGTMAYASPQQMDGDKGVPSDDLYALGATLYELLTGSPPFFRGDLRKQILEKVPPSMMERRAELAEEGMVLDGGQEISSNWEQGVSDCLSKEANTRPVDATALWRGLSGEKTQKTREEEQRKQREIAEQKRLAEEAWHVGEEQRRAEEEAKYRRQQLSVREQARQKQEDVARPQAKSSPLPWIIIACVVLGLVAWGMVSSNKPAGTRTVTVTDEAAIPNPPPNPVAAPLPPPDPPKTNSPPTVGSIPATKDQPFVNSLGMKFVPVVNYKDGQKVLFSIWETRVKDYEVYAAANSGVDMSWKNPGFTQSDAHPVTCVSWEDAVAFCKWLTEKERAAGKIGQNDEYRLPTDVEWSYAVGIGDKEDASKTPKEKDEKIADVYPWGTSWPPPKGAGNYGSSLVTDGFDRTSPVASFGANRYGVYDLGGNVWEWCGDYYDGESGSRVLRGGSWSSVGRVYLLSSCRFGNVPGYRNLSIGFRCVLVVSAR